MSIDGLQFLVLLTPAMKAIRRWKEQDAINQTPSKSCIYLHPSQKYSSFNISTHLIFGVGLVQHGVFWVYKPNDYIFRIRKPC